MRIHLKQNLMSGRYPVGGWSLAEICVAVAIGSLVLLAVAQIAMFTARSFVAMGNYADLDRASRNALDMMSKEIREAKVYGYAGQKTLYFTNMDNSWFSYLWDPTARTVSRITGRPEAEVDRTVLLTGCDYFSFRVFLRNPTNNFWFPYSAAGQEGNTKLVDLSWRCSRRVLAQYNTESVQTAKIVLRN